MTKQIHIFFKKISLKVYGIIFLFFWIQIWEGQHQFLVRIHTRNRNKSTSQANLQSKARRRE